MLKAQIALNQALNSIAALFGLMVFSRGFLPVSIVRRPKFRILKNGDDEPMVIAEAEGFYP